MKKMMMVVAVIAIAVVTLVGLRQYVEENSRTLDYKDSGFHEVIRLDYKDSGFPEVIRLDYKDSGFPEVIRL